jgi:hypothetical protein
MVHLHLLYALFVGISVACVWSFLLNSSGPWNNLYWFFLVIFLFSWGGGVWITPFGPTGWGVSWLPFVMMGVVVALLLSAATPRHERRRPVSGTRPVVVQAPPASSPVASTAFFALDLFFWFLVILLVTSILGRYTWFSAPA